MKKDHWWVPLTGVAFVLVLIASFIVGGGPPEAGEGPGEVASFYSDNKSSVQFGAAMTGWAVVMLVFFAGYLRSVLREAEGEGGMLSLVAFAGAVMLGVGGALDATLLFAMAEASDSVAPAQLQTIQAIWDNDFLPLAVGSSVFLLASGLSLVRHKALAPWLGWVAIVLAVLGVTPVGFVALMGGALWIIVVSVMLAIRARGSAAPKSEAPPVAVSPAT